MKELFLPYELAVIAKAKGFDEPCFALYNESVGNRFEITNDGKLLNYERQNLDLIKVYNWIITAPLYQQIIDWFRIQHGMAIEMSYDFTSDEHKWICVTMSGLPDPENIKWHAGSLIFGNNAGTDYYDVLRQGIEKAFELIEVNVTNPLNS